MTPPKISAKRGVACPKGIGRFIVRRMCGSISASYHMLMAFEPPADNVPPTKVTRATVKVSPHVLVTSRVPYRARVSWTRMAHSAVICSRTITRNFINCIITAKRLGCELAGEGALLIPIQPQSWPSPGQCRAAFRCEQIGRKTWREQRKEKRSHRRQDAAKIAIQGSHRLLRRRCKSHRR